ncbi:MAG TPA: hypothetical protein PLN68_09635 [Elusimicrobiales bacterium]|nr:hypothetical protein [Elusimicrobiales bacterium]
MEKKKSYTQDIAEYLIKKGYKVFAPGFAEYLERHRYFSREIQRINNLDTQKTDFVIGTEGLKEYLKNHNNIFVKVNTFRGDYGKFYK